MPRLSTLVDPLEQDPKPLLGTFVADNNWGYYGYSVFDSNFNNIGGSDYSTNGEVWNNYSGRIYTYGTFGSGSAGSTYWVKATTMNQAEGNWQVQIPASGEYSKAPFRNPDACANWWPFYGVHIGQEGVRQRISIYLNGNTIRVHHRGMNHRQEQIDVGWFKNATGEPGAAAYGTVSYNDRTRQLIIIQGSGNSYRLHSWTNKGRSLNEKSYKTGTIYRFMQEAFNGTNGASYFYNDFTWSTTGSNSYAESQYHFRVIAGDNGRVGLVRMTPSNQTVHAWIQPNPSGTALTTAPTAVSILGLTTSYGIEQGNFYGQRSNITWDNNWVACYSPYYYYGCGINLHVVSVADPSRGYYYQSGNTDVGWSIAPIQENKFALRFNHWNTDGGLGMQVGILDPSNITLTNSAGLGLPTSAYMDAYAPNTSYPVLTPMTSWFGGSR